MLILCKGKRAQVPYEVPDTGSRVYSLEELCHYVYNNIYSITEEFFVRELAVWIREETDHKIPAKKLERMIEAGENLKDLVVTLLCGCDYYREEEIRQIIRVMDGIANLPLHRKKKIKADNYLKAGLYGKSLLEYRKLLQSAFAVNFTTEEYGDILHNQAIAAFYTASFDEAGRYFLEAYARNHRTDSMKHYFYLLLMQDKEEEFVTEAARAGWSKEKQEEVRAEYRKALSQCHIPKRREDDLEQYKKELRKLFVNT